MKKIAALFVLLICLFALSVSSSEQAMRVITKQRYAGTGLLHSDKYTFGDLYGLSYLPEFRLPKSEGYIEPPTGLPAEKDIDLYIVGDSYLYSYLEPIPANYARVARVDFRRWAHVPARVETFQSPRKKVLLIESVERNLANVLGLGHVRAVFEPTPPVDKPWWERWNEAIKAALYHPTLESNLDFTLFNVALLSPLKVWKATWNDRVFGRPVAEVVRSSRGDRLFMKETVGPQEMGSSFREISDAEIQQRIHEMEEIQTFYRAKGFDLVIFSLMPNPVALLDAQRGKGNQLLARLQAASAGQLTIIDPTERLKSNAEAYFYRSDSHWNQRGARVWLDQLNEVLRGTAR